MDVHCGISRHVDVCDATRRPAWLDRSTVWARVTRWSLEASSEGLAPWTSCEVREQAMDEQVAAFGGALAEEAARCGRFATDPPSRGRTSRTGAVYVDADATCIAALDEAHRLAEVVRDRQARYLAACGAW